MKSSHKILIALGTFIFCQTLSAEVLTLKVALEIKQCVYVEEGEECAHKTLPYKELQFKLIKNVNGQYSSSQEASTYLGTDQFKALITLKKEQLDDQEIAVEIQLVAREEQGREYTKSMDFTVGDLLELGHRQYQGDPIERPILHYWTETSHKLHIK